MAHSLAMALLAVLAILLQLTGIQGIRTGVLQGTRTGRTLSVDMNVTLVMGTPSCGAKRQPVVLINGMFQPTLYARVNDTIQITLRNLLPTHMPQTSSGISVHFHGFGMWDSNVWADGTAYVTQCPLQPGQTWTYSFLANESPGTYLYHDHSAMNRANGLTGAFVLDLPDIQPGIPSPVQVDGDHLMFITDWHGDEGNMLAMQMNRPYDPTYVTRDSGSFKMASNPVALLINGNGIQGDCNLTQLHNTTATPGRYPPVCNVSTFSVSPSRNSSGCKHEAYTVKAGSTYRFRIINGGTSEYLTICFENHTVSLMAADTTPMDYPVFSNGCIDIHTGQRYDISLTADQPPGLYWISVHTRYESSAPSAYAVLRYAGVNPRRLLPHTATPQALMPTWNLTDLQKVATSDFILGYNDNYDFESYYNLFMHGGSYDAGILFYEVVPDKLVMLNITDPVMSNGAVKWAMNNVAMPVNPPCTPVMESLVEDPKFLSKYLAPPDTKGREAASHSMLSTATYDSKAHAVVYNGSSVPELPVVGMQVIEVPYNAVVDVVINNLAAGDMQGDHYLHGGHRNYSIPHPMHMHGHRFYVLGTGPGVFSHALHEKELNYRSPILRDTATVMGNSWLYLRFKAKNPGIWPLHCHILWHAYMGQQVYFAVALDKVKKRSHPGPKCLTDNCINDFAPYSKSWVAKHYKSTRYQLPSR